MKIYTKRGDAGQTSLVGGGDFSKDHLRVHAYGTVDELNSLLGLALSYEATSAEQEALSTIQQDLFVLGAELATVKPSAEVQKTYLQDQQIRGLEKQIDQWESELPPLKNFILPGGGLAGATLHLARTVCRRAERLLVALHHQEAQRPVVLQYLNRLSDWLFVLARKVNLDSDQVETPWRGLDGSKSSK